MNYVRIDAITAIALIKYRSIEENDMDNKSKLGIKGNMMRR